MVAHPQARPMAAKMEESRFVDTANLILKELMTEEDHTCIIWRTAFLQV